MLPRFTGCSAEILETIERIVALCVQERHERHKPTAKSTPPAPPAPPEGPRKVTHAPKAKSPLRRHSGPRPVRGGGLGQDEVHVNPKATERGDPNSFYVTYHWNRTQSEKPRTHLWRWDYRQGHGPSTWAATFNGKLGNGQCDGKRQSPIDIVDSKTVRRKDLDLKTFFKVSKNVVVINKNGELSVRGTSLRLSRIVFEGKRYSLMMIELHSGSGHTIDGRREALELDFIFRGEQGRALALAVLYRLSSQTNSALNDQLNWSRLPKAHTVPSKAQSKALKSFSPASLMPEHLAYYTYMGSFLSPPCTEGVQWVVLTSHMEISKAQYAIMPAQHSFRPVQPLNGRVVYKLSAAPARRCRLRSAVYCKGHYHGIILQTQSAAGCEKECVSRGSSACEYDGRTRECRPDWPAREYAIPKYAFFDTS